MGSRGERSVEPAMSLETYRLLSLSERLAETEHRCGRCTGPYGKSAITCPNDVDRIESERLARIKKWKQARDAKEQS